MVLELTKSTLCGCFLFYGFDRRVEVGYTEGVMRYMLKITAGSLMFTLAFFAGSFCLYPMSAEATDVLPEMVMAEHTAIDDANVIPKNDVPTHTWDSCVFNCGNQALPAIIIKQSDVNPEASLLADSISHQPLLPDASFVGATHGIGTHSPSLDILLSVFKKE